MCISLKHQYEVLTQSDTFSPFLFHLVMLKDSRYVVHHFEHSSVQPCTSDVFGNFEVTTGVYNKKEKLFCGFKLCLAAQHEVLKQISEV